MVAVERMSTFCPISFQGTEYKVRPWLREHSGAEIICRDRASAYSSAIRDAAPEAQEIADRWHLLANLSAAVEKTCH
ncbi:transposase [Streptomyces boninensis]|uniref:transposase n=1 Tax=Streptomyces boninensis TaxID=2039455 RepID=UPI003B2283B7